MTNFEKIVKDAINQYGKDSYKQVEQNLLKNLEKLPFEEVPENKNELNLALKNLFSAAAESRKIDNPNSKTRKTLLKLAKNQTNVAEEFMNTNYNTTNFDQNSSWTSTLNNKIRDVVEETNSGVSTRIGRNVEIAMYSIHSGGGVNIDEKKLEEIITDLKQDVKDLLEDLPLPSVKNKMEKVLNKTPIGKWKKILFVFELGELTQNYVGYTILDEKDGKLKKQVIEKDSSKHV